MRESHMICHIKSTLKFTFLMLVAGTLVLSNGCFDASSQRAERERGTPGGSGTSSRSSTRSDRDVLASRRRVEEANRPSEGLNPGRSTMRGDKSVTETPADTASPGVSRSDTAASLEQSPSTAERKTSLPKTINWDIPQEKAAMAEEKIAAETVVRETVAEQSFTPDSHPEGHAATMEPTPEQPAEQKSDAQDTTQHDDNANPFAAIAESLEMIAESQDESQNDADDEKIVAMPATDDAIEEDVWEKAQSLDHDLLERMVIKKTDDAHNWRLRRNTPNEQEVTDGTDSSGDTDWKAVEPGAEQEPEPAVAPAVEQDDSEIAQADEQDVPVMEPTLEPTPDSAEEPVIDPNLVPTLPNVQADDSDPFGINAAAAFEQFGQMTDDSPTTPATTPQTAVPATPPSAQNEGFDFGGWDDADGFDTGGGTTSPFDGIDPDETISSPQRDVTPAPVTPPAARPSQPQPAPGPGTLPDADDPGTMGPLTPVEEYLINEAKMSPVKLMESVELLYKLNKPHLARRLLRQFTDTELPMEDCRQISKRVNPAILLRISIDEEYQPEGGLVVRKIVEGSQSYFESRSVIENAMQLLLTGTDREKDDATRTILNGGETSIEYLLERLAQSGDPQELSETMTLLNAMGESARRALQESLIPTTPLGMRAARLLTQMGRASDSRFLLPLMFDSRLTDAERRETAGMVQTLSRNVPNQESAAATMYSLATNYFREKVSFMTDANNHVPLWMLREGAELPKFVTIHEADASRYFAEKFARFATCLDPSKPAYRQLWIVAFFDLKGAEMGSDNSITLDENLLRAMLNGLTVDDMESALRMAMQQDHPIAARVAAELMGEIDDVETVIYKRGSQSALVKAAGFSDRRVRFAALRSIIKLNPDRPYPGSSTVSQSLVYFTRATGKKRAVVVCPWLGDATTIANLLTPLGYTPETATMGRQAMQLAIDSADTELMMLDVRTPSSNVEFLIQDMRADNRTHDVPIAVLANGWRVSRAERAAYADNRLEDSPQDAKNRFVIGDDEFLVERDMMTKAERAAFGSKMAHAFPRPYDEASAKFVVDNLLRESGVEHVPPQLRLAEAKLSLEWVTAMYQKPNLYRFENIEQIAWDTLWLPELTEATLPLVELIPTANAQRWLTHIVSTTAFPIETRDAALAAFEKNARSHGVLIRGRQILDLYDMYNASGGEPVASQQTRSSLLDVVEKYANYMQNVSFQQ
ncbi:MAG: hypothetical protein FWH27_01785 [Planctomycetaceae bacterium]|nr:hypothetical protein [Planctomycetaceae bacterium]